MVQTIQPSPTAQDPAQIQPAPEQKGGKKNLSVLLPFVVFILLVLLGGGYYVVQTMVTHQSPITQNISSQKKLPSQTSVLYTNPLGVSFMNPTPKKITDYDILTLCKTTGEFFGQSNPKTLPTSKATNILFQNYEDNTTPWLTIIRMDALGTNESYADCGSGDLNAYRFFNKDDSLFTEVQKLISKTIMPAQTKNFNDVGNSMRYQVTSYTNTTSHVFGITNLKIYGFAVPGLTISREYFLHDPESKYIIYLSYSVTCPALTSFEIAQDNISTDSAAFDGDRYTKGLHDLSSDCDNNSPAKKTADVILSTFKFGQ